MCSQQMEGSTSCLKLYLSGYGCRHITNCLKAVTVLVLHISYKVRTYVLKEGCYYNYLNYLFFTMIYSSTGDF